MPTEVVHGGPAGRRSSHDLATGRVELVYDWDVGGRTRLPNGLEVEDSNRTTFSIVEGDPLSAAVRCRMAGQLGRGDWQTRCETESVMTCDAEELPRHPARCTRGRVTSCVFEHTWTSVIPRDLV